MPNAFEEGSGLKEAIEMRPAAYLLLTFLRSFDLQGRNCELKLLFFVVPVAGFEPAAY